MQQKVVDHLDEEKREGSSSTIQEHHLAQRTLSNRLVTAIGQLLRGGIDDGYFLQSNDFDQELVSLLGGEENHAAFIRLTLEEKKLVLIPFILSTQYFLLFDAINATIERNWNMYDSSDALQAFRNSYFTIDQNALNKCLPLAAKEGFNFLVAHLVNLGAQDPTSSALYKAATNGRFDLVAFFVQGIPPLDLDGFLKRRIDKPSYEQLEIILSPIIGTDRPEAIASLLELIPEMKVKAFHLAVREGRMAVVQHLVSEDKGIVNSPDYHGNSSLFYAITHQKFKIADFLLKNGAHLDIVYLLKLLKNAQKSSEIHYIALKIAEFGTKDAKDQGLYCIILKIEEFGKKKDMQEQRLAFADFQDAIKSLLIAGADIDHVRPVSAEAYRPFGKETLLAHMVQKLSSLLVKNAPLKEEVEAKIIVVQFLLRNGANPENIGLDNPRILIELGKTMPALIFDYHFIKAQKYFKSSEEQAEKVHEKSPQVLWEILDRLLDKAAPFWSTNEVLGTTIRLIREMGQRYKHDSLRLLALCRVAEEMLGVSIGYDKCSQGDHEMVPMSANAVTAPSSSISFVAAANRGATKIIERFLALQGERLPRDHKVRALYQAALQGHTEIVHILLTQGRLTKQDINQVILDPSEEALDNHTSILSAAAKNGHLEIVQLLVNHGAEVNFEAENAPTAEEKDNRPLLSSALEYATANNRREIIDFLLSNGALIGNALQIAIDSSGPDLAEFFVKIAKQKGRIAECGSALLDAAKSQRLDIVMLFLGQGVPPTRGILDAIAANFNDQDLLNIFSHLKHPRYKEGALRAAIHSGRFLTAGYLLSEGVNIDYLASRGKTLLGSLVQEIEASLKQDVQVKAESLEASWKIKLRFLLEHGANPEVLNCSPSVLALLGEKTPVKLKFNYFYMQSAAKPDQEEKYEEDDQAFQVQELRNRLLGSLCNAELPQSQFSFFTGKSRSVPAAVIEDIRAICEQEEWSTQALEILIKIAREAGVEVKTSYSLSLNQVVGENTRRPAGLSLVLEEGIGKEEQKEEDLLNSRASLNSDASFFSAPVSSSSGWFPKSWAITSWTSVFSPTPKNPPSSAKSLKKNEPLQSQQQMQGNNTKSQNLGLSFDG